MTDFEPGQVLTVFRSRLREDGQDEYYPMAAEMTDLARTMPGFVDAKVFTAADGERVTVVTFADEQSQAGWRAHERHRGAQRRGRKAFYRNYSVQVATVTAVSGFPRD